MAARKNKRAAQGSKLVRKSILLDPVKLEQARKAVGASSTTELVRLALDQLIQRLPLAFDEEE